jgi:MFS family permease
MTSVGSQARSGLTRYWSFLGRGDVLRLVISSMLARLPGGMAQLAVILVIQQRWSLGAAGVAVACGAVGSGIGGPLRGRSTDRFGARRVLLASATAQVTALLGLLVAVVAAAPLALDVILAGLIGASQPPVNPVMRTIWSRRFEGDMRRTAFSIESVLLDLSFIIGPALVAVVATASSPRWCLVMAALLSASGCVLLASAPESRDWRVSPGERHWLGAWRVAEVRRLLPISFAVTGSIVAIELALVAFARAHGHPAISGGLIALLSVGSIVGGLCYGAMSLQASVLRQLALASAVLGAGFALGSLAGSGVVLAVIITATGLFLAPTITLEYAAMDEVADPDFMTESFALLNAAGQGGAAVAAVLAGFAGQHFHENAVFLVAATLALIATLLALYQAMFARLAMRRGHSS